MLKKDGRGGVEEGSRATCVETSGVDTSGVETSGVETSGVEIERVMCHISDNAYVYTLRTNLPLVVHGKHHYLSMVWKVQYSSTFLLGSRK